MTRMQKTKNWIYDHQEAIIFGGAITLTAVGMGFLIKYSVAQNQIAAVKRQELVDALNAWAADQRGNGADILSAA